MPTGKKGEITPKEDLFLEAYMANGFNRRKAVTDAGIKCGDPSSYGATILNRDHVQNELAKRLQKKKNKFFVNEQDIMEGLYAEAQLQKNEGGSQQGRIQAWVHLGKQLGMFSDRIKELEAKNGGTQINIINYNAPQGANPKKEKIIKETKEAIEHIPAKEIEGVVVTNYSKETEE